MDQSPAPAQGRRFLGSLSPRMVAFVVADVLLLLVFLVVLTLFLSGDLGGSPTAGATSPSSATGPASASPSASAGAPGAEAATFALPSGNIACEMSTDAATCTIANSSATPPKDDTCAGVVGLKLTVTADGASTPCVEGAAPGAAAAGTPVLDYGQSKTVGDFTCTSSSTGVTCKHVPTGKGFQLAKAGSKLF